MKRPGHNPKGSKAPAGERDPYTPSREAEGTAPQKPRAAQRRNYVPALIIALLVFVALIAFRVLVEDMGGPAPGPLAPNMEAPAPAPPP